MLILIALLVSIIAFSVSPLLSVAAFVVAGIISAPNGPTLFLVVLLGIVAGGALL